MSSFLSYRCSALAMRAVRWVCMQGTVCLRSGLTAALEPCCCTRALLLRRACCAPALGPCCCAVPPLALGPFCCCARARLRLGMSQLSELLVELVSTLRIPPACSSMRPYSVRLLLSVYQPRVRTTFDAAVKLAGPQQNFP